MTDHLVFSRWRVCLKETVTRGNEAKEVRIVPRSETRLRVTDSAVDTSCLELLREVTTQVDLR